MKVYWIGVEFYLNSNHKEFGEADGGFVFAFVKAIGEKDALSKIEEKLIQQNLIPAEIDFNEPYGDTKWEKEEENIYYQSIIQKADETQEVVFDDFHMYKTID